MAHQLIVKDSVTGECGLVDPLCPITNTSITLSLPSTLNIEDSEDNVISADLSGLVTDCCQSNTDAIAALMDVFVNGGDLNNYTLNFNDNDGNNPSFSIDLTSLPDTLCADQDFVDCLASNSAFNDVVTTLNQNADGSFTYISEDSTQTTIDICSMTAGLPLFGPLQCS